MRQDRHLHLGCKLIDTLHFGPVDRDIGTAQFSEAPCSGKPGFPQCIDSVLARDIYASKEKKSAEIFTNRRGRDLELPRRPREKHGHRFSSTFEVEEIGFRCRTTVKMHV